MKRRQRMATLYERKEIMETHSARMGINTIDRFAEVMIGIGLFFSGFPLARINHSTPRITAARAYVLAKTITERGFVGFSLIRDVG